MQVRMIGALAGAGMMMGLAASPATADIVVGVNMAVTGPGASLAALYKPVFDQLAKQNVKIGDQPVRFVFLDDGTDPSASVRNARKLITEEKADVIIGSTFTPGCLAIAAVAAETKTPQLCGAPVRVPKAHHPWVFYVPQKTTIMIGAVVEHMKKKGVKRVAYIGFADGWGDLVFSALKEVAPKAGIEIVADERYNRPDTSVTAQALRIVSKRPDAVLVGASGTPAALPHIALVQRNFRKGIYHTHGVIGPDFLRVGGKAVNGAIAPAGPLMVANQLPDDNPIKKVALDFFKAFEANYPHVRNSFAGYSYDAWLLVQNAAKNALKKAKPGTAEFRVALRDALEATNGLVGTHAVYSMSKDDHNGVDQRAVVLVEAQNGAFKLLKE